MVPVRSLRNNVVVALSVFLSSGCGSGGTSQPSGRPENSVSASESTGGGPAVATPDTRTGSAAEWVDATVPAGTELHLALQDSLDSDTSRPSTLFKARLLNAVTAGPIEILPAGSITEGIVKSAVPGKSGGTLGGSLSIGLRVVWTPIGTGGSLNGRITSAGPTPSGQKVKVEAGKTIAESGTLSSGSPGKPLVLGPGTPLTFVLQQALQIKVKH